MNRPFEPHTDNYKLDRDCDDYKFATSGFIATLPPGETQIVDPTGQIVFDTSSFDFIVSGAAPPTVNPVLWRRAQLLRINGLFEVVANRIYQVRGLDISNMTFCVGAHGYIVVDTLLSSEMASVAYELVRKHVGEMPITNIIFIHPLRSSVWHPPKRDTLASVIF